MASPRYPRWKRYWPFEFYVLPRYPKRWVRGASYRNHRPLVPRAKLLNWTGPPPYGVSLRWLRLGLVYWFPRWYGLKRWLG